jgi:hypothetical protein
VRVPLDQRQRLQHRVVHAGGHVRPLLASDARRALDVTVEREPPHPGAGDQEKRPGDGAGRQQRRGRTPAREERHGAQRRERQPPIRERRVRAEAASLPQGHREPRGDQRDPEHRPVGETERAQQDRARDEREHGRDPDAPPTGPRPESEVEEDPGPARQRQ